jgi:large subunit ribosomal protein L29
MQGSRRHSFQLIATNMDIKELRNLSVDRLRDLIGETSDKIRNTRFTVSTRQQGHVRTLRAAKRELAKMKTILREKEIASTPDQH